MSKCLGGIIGCKDKTSSWHFIGFPDSSNIGSTVSCRAELLLYRKRRDLSCVMVLFTVCTTFHRFWHFIPSESLELDRASWGVMSYVVPRKDEPPQYGSTAIPGRREPVTPSVTTLYSSKVFGKSTFNPSTSSGLCTVDPPCKRKSFVF